MMEMTTDYRGPYLVPTGDWLRRLHGPWTMLLQSTRTNEVKAGTERYVEAAVMALFGRDLIDNCRAMILDVDGWILIGYSTDPAMLSQFGHPVWAGTEMGFALLESTNLVDPMELAVWESLARRTVEVNSW